MFCGLSQASPCPPSASRHFKGSQKSGYCGARQGNFCSSGAVCPRKTHEIPPKRVPTEPTRHHERDARLHDSPDISSPPNTLRMRLTRCAPPGIRKIANTGSGGPSRVGLLARANPQSAGGMTGGILCLRPNKMAIIFSYAPIFGVRVNVVLFLTMATRMCSILFLQLFMMTDGCLPFALSLR